MNTFARYIEQFKNELDLTDKEIGEIMGVGQVTLENYLSGYVRPTEKSLQRLLSALALQKPEDGSVLSETPPFEALSPAEGYGLAGKESCFVTRIKDDNLSSLKIFSGSYAVIRSCLRPAVGDILCVCVDGGESCLMWYSENGQMVRMFNDKGEILIPAEEFANRVRV
ncbi:MAG: helix-turn-helix domain-containing protein, partial [Clostridia bacterium]